MTANLSVQIVFSLNLYQQNEQKHEQNLGKHRN